MSAAPGSHPVGHQRGDSRWLLDHVADHPLDRCQGAPLEAIGTHMGDHFGAHDGGRHRPVVDRGDAQAAPGQLPGPPAGRGAEVDRALAGAQALLQLGLVEKRHEGLGELLGTSAGCILGHAQARNARWPGRAIVGGVDAQQGFALGNEQHCQVGEVNALGAKNIVLLCHPSERRSEAAVKSRQGFGGVGVGRFDGDAAKTRWRAASGLDDGRYPVVVRHPGGAAEAETELSREGEIGEAYIAVDGFEVARLVEGQQDKSAVDRAFQLAGMASAQCIIRQFRRRVFFKAGAATNHDARDLLGVGFAGVH